MTLADHRAAIATALTSVGIPINSAPITDPVPPCISISNPVLTIAPKARGGTISVEWAIHLTLSRLSKSGVASDADKYLSSVLAALTGGTGIGYTPVQARYYEPSEQTGFILPTYIITGTTTLVTC